MTVGDLIDKLSKFNKQIPVAIDDWSEQWSPPSEMAAEVVELVKDGVYLASKDRKLPLSPSNVSGSVSGTYVCIGGR